MLRTFLPVELDIHTPGSLDRVQPIKHNRHLFQSVSLRLGVEEVDNDDDASQDNGEDNVVFPPNCFEGDRIDERVEEDGDVS